MEIFSRKKSISKFVFRFFFFYFSLFHNNASASRGSLPNALEPEPSVFKHDRNRDRGSLRYPETSAGRISYMRPAAPVLRFRLLAPSNYHSSNSIRSLCVVTVSGGAAAAMKRSAAYKNNTDDARRNGIDVLDGGGVVRVLPTASSLPGFQGSRLRNATATIAAADHYRGNVHRYFRFQPKSRRRRTSVTFTRRRSARRHIPLFSAP